MNNSRNVLVVGASFAGLATAYWMRRLNYAVTVVEIAAGLRRGGTPVDIKGNTVAIMNRMGLLEKVLSNRLPVKATKLVNADGVAGRSNPEQDNGGQPSDEEYEIERDVLLDFMFDAVRGDVEFVFGDSITSLDDAPDGVGVSFNKGPRQSFDLVFGCDGVHSTVRKCWFGAEKEYSHFLEAYGSVSIVNKSLIPENTSQIYNEPGKAVVLSAYNKKTDIILIFSAQKEIPFDYRNEEQKRDIVIEQFSGVGWRTAELLQEVKQSENFYFDVLSQIKMQSWTKGRVALVGDAAYCASPAAGRGGALAIDGAASLADAFAKCGDDFALAFREYNESFRPFIEEVQADAVNFGVEFLVPRTAEAIQRSSRFCEKPL
jgi:2-polyprenyl-6-methoxyphenol hydroxylase-like FAD-dependent oxidoreductase